MIKRAMISGLNSTGVDVADLRVLPAAVSRHLLKTQAYDAGFHVGVSHSNPEVVAIRFFEQPGITLTPALQKEIEKNFTRQELRRAGFDEVGQVSYPARVRESYAQDLLSQLDADAIRRRGFRIVVDYSYSAASYVLPLLFGPLGVEAVTAHGFATERSIGRVGAARVDRRGEAARLRDRRRARRRARPRRRAAVADRRARPRDPGRADAPALPAPAARDRARGQGRLPGHGHAARRRDPRGQRARGRADAELARRADGSGRGGGRRLRGRARRRLRLPRVPARLRRRRQPVQAARAARAARPAALGARRRPARLDARAPPARRARGRSRASSCASSTSASPAASST